MRFVLLAITVLTPGSLFAATIDFNREIRPILSENCFTCHGPDEGQRKAKLRLDTREGAFLGGKKYGPAIVPGKPAQSELVKRLKHADETSLMPPPETNKKLTKQQIQLVEKWIEEGAEYRGHWAFIAPKIPATPHVLNEAWIRTPFDRFILARLEKEGMKPSAEAERHTLIRRVTLDLTGLPPTKEEVELAVNDPSPKWYETFVQKLLNSPRFGERMALDWLDAARFADTHGYHLDSARDMTLWREWVIEAFNSNLPYDQFTREQLAGDLLPNATNSQKIASGFLRNNMINYEGGAIAEEYLNAYIVDRVNTTSTIWLGLTVGCAQCHDHKYDPISQKEFYQLYSFFHNVPESGLDGRNGNAVPVLRVTSASQQTELEQLRKQLKSVSDKKAIEKKIKELEATIPSTMVMQEMPQPRKTFVLNRGAYDKKGEEVRSQTPAFLPSFKLDQPKNRLGLANWLVSSDHPLTSRVTVNRYWQLFFGTGLVKTAEDFGSQGEWPSHPELLDFLARDFQNSGWNLKKFIQQIVTSATYRQSSVATPESIARDPENRLLGRMSRLRLQAEFLRDQALFVSGLLNPEIGGKSVSPYQPAGLWEELASRGDSKSFSAQFFEQSHGKDLYRRSMYTFWKRTSPPPSMTTLDAPDREICTIRRSRTNTPLQALVLMNDPGFVEASRKFAERILSSQGDRLEFAVQTVLGRNPTSKEKQVLEQLLARQQAAFAANPARVKKLLQIGEAPVNNKLDQVELAAWTMVASTILNLDEALNRN
jgi:hypothetical protein